MFLSLKSMLLSLRILSQSIPVHRAFANIFQEHFFFLHFYVNATFISRAFHHYVLYILFVGDSCLEHLPVRGCGCLWLLIACLVGP